MIVIESDQVVYFDVDDTLVMWDWPIERLEETISIPLEDHTCYRVLPHWKHIDQMRRHKARGHTICVWSAGGYDWALAVVKMLKLENIVDIIIRKPVWFYDDLKTEEFMPEVNRFWYENE